MDWDLVKKYYIFGLSLVVSIFLIWFGSKFLFLPKDKFDSTELFILGLFVVLAGILVVSSPTFYNKWSIGGLLLFVGFFMFARAAGAIDYPWIAKAIGVASWGSAALLAFITFPRPENRKT